MTPCICGMLEHHIHLGTFTIGLTDGEESQVYLIEENFLMLKPNDVLAAWPGRKVVLVLLVTDDQHPSSEMTGK